MPRFLFIGDIVGRPGREAVAGLVPALRRELELDLVIANAENAAAGSGLNAKLARDLLGCEVDALTLGDHVWDQRGFEGEIASLERVCRPANLPAVQPGRTSVVVNAAGGFRLGVFTVLGRTFMGPQVTCPFETADHLIDELSPHCDAIFVEIHAEATSEKIAMARHLDGRACLVAGTHTHVPTADARLLAGGTAAITDVGMTGPYDSVLGREVAPVLAKFRDGLPRRFEIATGDVRLCGVVVEVSADSRTACSVVRLERALPVPPAT